MAKDKNLENVDAAVESSSLKSEVEIKRRKAVTRITATVGIVATMSGNWKKPVLTTAVLPAHAVSTCPGGSDCEEDSDFSDIRMKKNIHKLESSGLGFQLYRFEYRGDADHKTYVGVMAQHIEDSHPEAIIEGSDGFYRVNYEFLGLKMTSLEEWDIRGIEAVKAH